MISYIGFASVLVLILISLARSISMQTRVPSFDKLAAYECGFDPFGDTRIQFNVQFYIVSILFIIFDLEIMFLFPRALIVAMSSFYSVCMILLFIILLTVGFAYEWINGALEWN